MKKYILIPALLASTIVVAAYRFAPVAPPAKVIQLVMNNTIADKQEIVDRYDRHIEDIQKRYDCVKAATSDEGLESCDRTHIPERGCEF